MQRWFLTAIERILEHRLSMVRISRNKHSFLALALVLLTASVTPSQQTQNNQSPNRTLEAVRLLTISPLAVAE
ncbi:MAG TPA: hypothetical protein VFT48_21775 [Pyrinomonadaceae bacterium]|nr:hypothetical protein [Pyrinomonadaceae bacterium]